MVNGAGFALGVFGDGRFEVVIEGAVGGFVEFFGIEGFVGGCWIGFRWVGCGFEHRWNSLIDGAADLLLPNIRVATVRRLVDRASREPSASEGALRTTAITKQQTKKRQLLETSALCALINPGYQTRSLFFSDRETIEHGPKAH
jgi:hypothetical protein